MNTSHASTRDRQFEETLRDGISAAKSKQHNLARTLLNRAILINSSDSRPYVWLSTTTDNPDEQREYLEQAVARDPNNSAARRALAMLNGKIDPARLMPEGESTGTRLQVEEVEVTGQAFHCPKCGGRMVFSIQTSRLTCEYCRFEQAGEPDAIAGKPLHSVADHAEQALDFVVPTAQGHSWAEGKERFSCERCGAISVLPPGHKTVQCPYCGSNQLVLGPEKFELVGPHVILPMKLDVQQVTRQVRAWLVKGAFTPDGLRRLKARLKLRPAYYSCWTFDGTVEVRWTCEVAEGNGRAKEWVPSSGVETRFFDDVLVPGVKALSARDLEDIKSFDLQAVKAFKPEYLAGWPTVLYDRSLSDASLLGREQVMKKLRNELYDTIEFGKEKRNLTLGGGSWSGMTFKHILLPIWTGTYQFQGKEYRLLVNGQTGKVEGQKPRDTVKVVFTALSATMAVFVVIVLLWILLNPG